MAEETVLSVVKNATKPSALNITICAISQN
jgi:hypothetical protein